MRGQAPGACIEHPRGVHCTHHRPLGWEHDCPMQLRAQTLCLHNLIPETLRALPCHEAAIRPGTLVIQFFFFSSILMAPEANSQGTVGPGCCGDGRRSVSSTLLRHAHSDLMEGAGLQYDSCIVRKVHLGRPRGHCCLPFATRDWLGQNTAVRAWANGIVESRMQCLTHHDSDPYPFDFGLSLREANPRRRLEGV